MAVTQYNGWEWELPDPPWWAEFPVEYIACEDQYITQVVVSRLRPARSLVRERREGR
jgi:hypothetical protein